ncbi:hypothetical protein IV203_018476 [Nitzschia inconspicua]|uniref:Uncharacterized protein n=1 Tax=Nitzschia inconspicua TaxID=303405 RepID=A0A9K3M248_9STRA|nr:hypothetical protein IV203_018476 [Nitzschia inconspicua]
MKPNSCFKQPQFTSTQKKKVQFSENSARYQIIHFKDYTEDERNAYYYTIEDLIRFRGENNKTLRAMWTGQLPDTELFYFRGLEGELLKSRGKRKGNYALALFTIQEYQTKSCSVGLDDEWVEGTYRKITSCFVESARKAATYDEIQAEKVYRESNQEIMTCAVVSQLRAI